MVYCTSGHILSVNADAVLLVYQWCTISVPVVYNHYSVLVVHHQWCEIGIRSTGQFHNHAQNTRPCFAGEPRCVENYV